MTSVTPISVDASRSRLRSRTFSTDFTRISVISGVLPRMTNTARRRVGICVTIHLHLQFAGVRQFLRFGIEQLVGNRVLQLPAPIHHDGNRSLARPRDRPELNGSGQALFRCQSRCTRSQKQFHLVFIVCQSACAGLHRQQRTTVPTQKSPVNVACFCPPQLRPSPRSRWCPRRPRASLATSNAVPNSPRPRPEPAIRDGRPTRRTNGGVSSLTYRLSDDHSSLESCRDGISS